MNSTASWGDLSCGDFSRAQAAVLGIPFDGSSTYRKGAAAAPEQIRKLSPLLDAVTEEGIDIGGFRVWDEGDVPVNLDWGKYFAEVEQRAFRLLQSGKFCFFLGGDHSVSIPLLQAFAEVHREKKWGIIHFDAHPDLIEEYDGHPWSHACVLRRALELPGLEGKALTQVGIRTCMEEELEFLAANKEIRVIRAQEVYRRGLDYVLAELKGRYREYEAIYLTIDIDVLDPAYAPGTGYPEAGGLSTRELLELVKEAVLALPVKAGDLVEVAPPLDQGDITSRAALKIIHEIFGAVARRGQK